MSNYEDIFDFTEEDDETDEDGDLTIPFTSSLDVSGVYGVISASVKQARNGDLMANYVLRNKDGFINAIHFDVAYCLNEGDIAHVSGTRTVYNGAPQITISSIRKVDINDVDITEILPVSLKHKTINAEMTDMIDSISNNAVAEFVASILSDYPAFYNVPAAKRIHHAWIGGLADHSLQVARIVSYLAKDYECNTDIATAGALLHDIGKVVEIEPRAMFSYTDEGQLKGHSYIGAVMVRDSAIKYGLPSDIRDNLEHIILSHHGSLDKGAVVKPATREALLVHLADMLDASMVCAVEFIKNDRTDGLWTAYDSKMDMKFRK